jgi:hypothetical protein
MTSAFTQPSIADIAEDKLVERLFADPLWGTEFFELAGMRRGMLGKQRVPLDSAPGKFKGDIDVLRCVPDHTSACDWKDSFHTAGSPNTTGRSFIWMFSLS